MPSVSQENLRRLAARSIRVLQRHKDAEPAIGAYVGSLDVEAQEFIDAYDLVHTSAAKRRERRNNGVEETDRVVIVEDVISTGGTMISLINAIRQTGCRIEDVICVAEKTEYRGVERIRDETGVAVKCLLQLDLSGEHAVVSGHRQ